MAFASSPAPPPSGSSDASVSTPETASALRPKDQERLTAVSSDPSTAPGDLVRSLLQVGRDALNVQNGHLSRINPGLGRHTVMALVGPCSALHEGQTHDLSTTYCRSVIAANDLISLHHASRDGWAEDPAYQRFGFDCYVGAKIVVNQQLYGTVCFADPEPHSAPFARADHALVREIAHRVENGLNAPDSAVPRPKGAVQRPDLLQRVQALSNVGGWELTLPENRLSWTETTYDLYGLPTDYEPDLDSAISFFGEEAQATLRTALDRCRTEGRPYDLELPLFTADGMRRWVRVQGVPHDADGTVHRITGTIQDLTDEREAKQALQQERDRFEALFQSLPTPVARCRVEEETTPITAINDAFEDVFGVSRPSAEGTDINKHLAPEGQRDTAQHLTKRALEEGMLQIEVERQTTEGLRDFRLQVAGDDRTDAPPEVYAIYTDITELKERERTIRKERDLLNWVFETSPTAIVIFDASGTFVRASDRAQEFLGMEAQEVTQRKYNDPEWQVMTPAGDPLPDDELPFARVKKTNEPLLGKELLLEWPDGTRRLLSVSGAPLHDEDDSFAGAVFHLDDITERRQTQLSLVESERRFRGVFENAALGITLLDDNGRFIDVNPALASMMDRPADGLRGQHFEMITHPDDLDTDNELYEQLIQDERTSYQLEKRYVRPDGSSFWGHLTVSRLDGPDAVQAIGMVENIDLRKRQRRQLRKFQTVVENTHETVLVLDAEPRSEPGPAITYANPSIHPLTGYAPSEVQGRSLQWLFGKETEAWVLPDLWTCLQNGERHEGEILTSRKDGTPFVARWSIAPVHNGKGAITHWVAVLRDVTEQRQMDKRLLEVQDEERRRIDQELHDEMGGLLTTLQMTIELGRIEAEEHAAPTQRFDQLEDLVAQVSSVTRTISRRLHPKNLDAHGLSGALSTLVNDLQEQHDLEIALYNEVKEEERFPSLVEMTAFRVVQEALINVIRHADSEDAKVTLRTEENGLRLDVADNGTGFDPSTHPNDDAYGLDGVRERVERLNGTLYLESTEEGGTHLSATLPLSISSLSS